MWRTLRAPLAVLPLAACLWLPPAGDARPRVGLESVERSPGSAGGPLAPAAEPGARGWIFADSVLVFRTRAHAGAIRFRLWNRMDEPVHVRWDSPVGAAGRGTAACPDAAGAWALDASRDGGGVLAPGQSREGDLVPAARDGSTPGAAWRTVELACLVFDPAEPRAALRLWVQAGPRRYGYVFWYRLMEPPRQDTAGVPAARSRTARAGP